MPKKKTLCIVTAFFVSDMKSIAWLQALGDSLAELKLPPDWQLLWAVQEDGVSPAGSIVVQKFDFARYEAMEIRAGAAVCRNRALSRVGGDLVTNIDGDDLVLQGLAHSVELIDDQPDLVWVAGQVDDLHDDGSRTSFELSVSGHQPAGLIPAVWQETDQIPFHSLGFVCRVPNWRAVGGWIAMPTMSDDTNAVLSVTSLWDGHVSDEVVGLWRRHDRQNSFTNLHARTHDISWPQISQRIDAIREVLVPDLRLELRT